MISKAKLTGGLGAVTVGILAVVSMVGAQTAALSVSCTGLVLNNVITWNATATGGKVPYAFAWTGDSSVAGSTSTSIVASYAANGTYTVGIQVTDASSTVATSTCSGTVTSIVTTPTSTPPLPRMNPPSLTITPSGNFLARGMTVTGVGSTSFQAQVWGITYTINWAGNLSPELEFFFRFLMSTSTPMRQVAVGDEVGVSGRIDASAPFVVTAKVVRDYSITAPRHHDDEDEDNNNDNENENHGNGGDNRGNSFNVGDAQSRLKDLLKQLENLQKIFRSRGGDKHDD